MDRQAFVHQRKRRYMAQILDKVEEVGNPHLTPAQVEEIRGIIRAKMHALALDACDLLSLKPGEELNGAGVDLRDQLRVERRRPVHS